MPNVQNWKIYQDTTSSTNNNNNNKQESHKIETLFLLFERKQREFKVNQANYYITKIATKWIFICIYKLVDICITEKSFESSFVI